MIKAIKQFFDQHIAQEAATPATVEHRLRIATAAVLLETMRADFDVTSKEVEAVTDAVQSVFELPREETDTLIRLAEQEVRQATDYFQFTSLINKALTANEKKTVVELMWRVAYADGQLDKYEDHLIRKIAGLLHVSHRDFIAAKHRARTLSP